MHFSAICNYLSQVLALSGTVLCKAPCGTLQSWAYTFQARHVKKKKNQCSSHQIQSLWANKTNHWLPTSAKMEDEKEAFCHVNLPKWDSSKDSPKQLCALSCHIHCRLSRILTWFTVTTSLPTLTFFNHIGEQILSILQERKKRFHAQRCPLCYL